MARYDKKGKEIQGLEPPDFDGIYETLRKEMAVILSPILTLSEEDLLQDRDGINLLSEIEQVVIKQVKAVKQVDKEKMNEQLKLISANAKKERQQAN